MMNMPQLELPPAFLIAESPALDFLNTIAKPAEVEYEWLDSTSHLLDWLQESGLVSAEEIKNFRQSDWLDAHSELALQARLLRDWFREFVEVHAGKPLGISALPTLDPINKILANNDCYFQIQQRDNLQGGLFNMTKIRRWYKTDDLLLPIAEAIADLVCHVDWSLIKQCGGQTCTFWFVDVSKNRKRRWCTMAICGNRAKAAKHRAKKSS
jgi:predicted RNA-binding Zn ribbon-like protein